MTNSDRKCREVQQAVCGESADALHSQEVKDHIASCPECRKFAEALNGSTLVSAPSTEVMNRAAALMRDDLRPVRPLASRLTYAMVLAAILCFAFGVASFSMRRLRLGGNGRTQDSARPGGTRRMCSRVRVVSREANGSGRTLHGRA